MKKVTLKDLENSKKIVGGAEPIKRSPVNSKGTETRANGVEVYDEFTGEKETVAVPALKASS